MISVREEDSELINQPTHSSIPKPLTHTNLISPLYHQLSILKTLGSNRPSITANNSLSPRKNPWYSFLPYLSKYPSPKLKPLLPTQTQPHPLSPLKNPSRSHLLYLLALIALLVPSSPIMAGNLLKLEDVVSFLLVSSKSPWRKGASFFLQFLRPQRHPSTNLRFRGHLLYSILAFIEISRGNDATDRWQ